MTDAVDEYFTQEEMNELKDYLANHPTYSHGSFEHNLIYLPLKTSQASLTNIPKAEKRNFYPLFKEPGYNLQFKSIGFYLENYNFPYCKKYADDLSIYKLYNNPANALIAEFNTGQNGAK